MEQPGAAASVVPQARVRFPAAPRCPQDGGMFKAQVEYAPYFYLQVKVGVGWCGCAVCKVFVGVGHVGHCSQQLQGDRPGLRVGAAGAASRQRAVHVLRLRGAPRRDALRVPSPHVPQDDLEMEVDSWLRRKFEGALKEVEVVQREDLDLVGWWGVCGCGVW